MKNNQKGITLVALVITIIVLLILAGVTIAALSGDNGILSRASQSRYQDQIGQTKDQISMVVYEATTEFYNDKYVNGNASAGNSGTAIKSAITTAISGGKFPSATVAFEGTGSSAKITITPQADSTKKVEARFNETTGEIGAWSNPS